MSVPSDSPESVLIKVGLVTVEAVLGNIVNENTDAIVNSTSDSMDFGGQVSRALLAKGGNKMLADCQARGNIGGDGVFAASAEGTTLHCKYLIHVDIGKQAGLLVKSCFTEADRLKLRSISLPVLGTGNHNADPEKIVPGLVSGLREFLCSVTPSHLRLIRFVVHPSNNVMGILKRSMMLALGRPAVQGREEPLGMEVPYRLPEAAMLPSASDGGEFSFEVPSTTLTDNRMNELKQFAALNGVQARFDKSIGLVTLSGSDVTSRSTVHQYIEQSSDELQAQEALQRKVQWQFRKDNEEWLNYSPALNFKIENAHSRGNNSLTYTSGIGTFVVDLQKKRDYLLTDEEYCANVRRFDKLGARP